MDDEQQVLARDFLRLALKKTGWTAYKLAKKAGVASTTITRPLNNEDYKFVPKVETLRKIAVAAGIEVPDMLKTTESIDFVPIRGLIPLVGDVQAGSWVAIPDEPEVSEWLPMAVPQYAGAALFALRVVGRSMDLVYPDGTIIIVCPPAEAGIREGNRVVVRRLDQAGRAETTLKEITRNADGVLVLMPRSSDPAHQEALPLPVTRDEATDVGYTIVGVVVSRYNIEPRGTGPLLQI